MRGQLLKIWIYVCLLPASQLVAQYDEAKIDALVQQEMELRQIPGLVVAIIHKGDVIHKKVYGYSNLSHQVPVKIETTFELASITKQVVAAGVLLLVQEGKLGLDEPIETYLDSLPDQWKKLTLRQLLSHTAGLAPQHEEYASMRSPWPKYISKEMMWQAAAKDKLSGKSGDAFRYHNVGFFLAEWIIEKVSAMPYRSFFRKNIFEPLEMHTAYFEDQLKVVPHQAQGYTIWKGERIKIWRVSQEEMAGGWGIYMGIEDMIKWSDALDKHTLLQPVVQAEMFRPIKLNNGESFRYGLGWFLPNRNGIDYAYHNGITGPEILKIPSEQLTVISLSNLGYGNGMIESDEPEPHGLVDLIAGEIIPAFQFKPKPQPIEQALLRQFEGSFSFNYDSSVEFIVEKDTLWIEDIYGKDALMHIGDRIFTFPSLPVVQFRFVDANTIYLTEEVWEDDWGKRID